MFGKEKSTMAFNGNVSNTTTLIAKGTEIIGDIKFSGTLEIEGKVRGNVIAAPGGEAMSRVLEHGEVEGDIHVPTVIVNGTVKGEVHSSTHVELAAKAKVDGNVHYNLIEMVKGAQINGSLVYGGGDLSSKSPNVASPAVETNQGGFKKEPTLGEN